MTGFLIWIPARLRCSRSDVGKVIRRSHLIWSVLQRVMPKIMQCFNLRFRISAVSLLSGFPIKREVTGVHSFPNIIPVSRLLIQGRIHDFDKNDSNKKSTLVDNRTVVVIIDESTQTCSLVVHWPRFFSACMDS